MAHKKDASTCISSELAEFGLLWAEDTTEYLKRLYDHERAIFKLSQLIVYYTVAQPRFLHPQAAAVLRRNSVEDP